MKISIGADHHGFALKEQIMQHFFQYTWFDVGTFSADRTDYPLFAQRAVLHIKNHKADCGILLCGTGIGMSIAANRFKGIYAALCWNSVIAQKAKEDDGANVLVLPADYLSEQGAMAIIQAWLDAAFKDGVYQRRLDTVDSYE